MIRVLGGAVAMYSAHDPWGWMDQVRGFAVLPAPEMSFKAQPLIEERHATSPPRIARVRMNVLSPSRMGR